MKPKTKTILFILFSFILGILCGWFIHDSAFIKTGLTPPDFQKMLTERLHLDEHQIVQVDSILDARKQQMDVYRKQILAMRDTVRLEIRKVLTVDQNKTFDSIIQKITERETKKQDSETQKK